LRVHYLRNAFRRERDFGASRVNYDFADLPARDEAQLVPG
jgi:hypothetical protein